MEIIFLLLGLLIGWAGGWAWYQLKNQKSGQGNLEKIRHELAHENRLRTIAETELKSVKDLYAEFEAKGKDSFAAMAGQAMQQNSDSFLKLAHQVFEKHLQENQNEGKHTQQAIEHLVTPLKESLVKHEQLVKDIQQGSNNTFGSIRAYIEGLQKSQEGLAQETRALSTALRAPKIRGRWGEIGLKRLVEFSGLNPYCDFAEQHTVRNEDGILRPDLIVRLPDSKTIAVDSKVPLDAYLQALETEDLALRDTLLAKHAKAVEGHAKDLGSKGYWSRLGGSVDFVVLYMEVEPALGAALLHNKQLIQESVQSRVIFATPTTLIALLQTVAYSWKQQSATENATQIWESSQELYERLSTFTEYLEKLGQGIGQLTKSFNQAVGSWDSRVVPGFKKMEELGVKSSKKEPKTLEKNQLEIREIRKTKPS